MVLVVVDQEVEEQVLQQQVKETMEQLVLVQVEAVEVVFYGRGTSNGPSFHLGFGASHTYLDAKDLKTIETYWGIKLLPATISVISPMGHHGPVVQVTREKIQIWSTMEGYYPLFGQ